MTWEESNVELGRVRVRVRKGVWHAYYREMVTTPEGPPPEAMTTEPCWREDRWVFSTVHAPVRSTTDTLPHALWMRVRDGQEVVCDLVLFGGGFEFAEIDFSLMEQGLGI